MYHSSTYDVGTAVDSFWESDAPSVAIPAAIAFEPQAGEYDIAVVGGGFTGLSSALHLVREHSARVCVLEAGEFGWGASGRNGGFCNVSTALTLDAMLKRFGLDHAKAFLRAQFAGVDYVKRLIEQEGIDVQPQFGGTYEVAHKPAAFAALERKHQLLATTFGIESQLVSRDEFAETGFASPGQFGALLIPHGFGLDPLRLLRGLAKAAARHGATLVPGCRVSRVAAEPSAVLLHAAKGPIRARRVIIATNGYTPETLDRAFQGRLMPVISRIFTTRPLTTHELAAQNWTTSLGCATSQKLLYYFRMLPDRRLMFGGPGDTSGRPEDRGHAQSKLVRAMHTMFPEWTNLEVTHAWDGLVCTSQKFAPSVGRTDDDSRILYGLGYQGNGVAAANWTGKQLATVAAGGCSLEEAFPAVMLGLGRTFPLPSLRRTYLKAALLYYRWVD